MKVCADVLTVKSSTASGEPEPQPTAEESPTPSDGTPVDGPTATPTPEL
ncbi:MAG: hypothetical protein ACREQ9_14195 [Candidatus Binatia bacterium]